MVGNSNPAYTPGSYLEGENPLDTLGMQSTSVFRNAYLGLLQASSFSSRIVFLSLFCFGRRNGLKENCLVSAACLYSDWSFSRFCQIIGFVSSPDLDIHYTENPHPTARKALSSTSIHKLLSRTCGHAGNFILSRHRENSALLVYRKFHGDISKRPYISMQEMCVRCSFFAFLCIILTVLFVFLPSLTTSQFPQRSNQDPGSCELHKILHRSL